MYLGHRVDYLYAGVWRGMRGWVLRGFCVPQSGLESCIRYHMHVHGVFVCELEVVGIGAFEMCE